MSAQRQVSGNAGVLAALARGQAAAAASSAMFRNQLLEPARDGARDDRDAARGFDFLFGRWRVRNERLRERLVGSRDWQRFDAIAECRPILGGLGNVDEFVTDEFEPGVFVGMTLRLFDRTTRRWSLYWASNRGAVLEPPVVGGFVEGVGRFEGEDTCNGVPVRVRFVWSAITAGSARWEQAFSADGGRSWETNWRMHLTRLVEGEAANAGAAP